MTANQSEILVNHPNTKKALAVLKKFAKMEAKYKELEAAKKEAETQIRDAMIAAGVTKITIDQPGLSGYITLAQRTSFIAPDLDAVPADFHKKTLDTAKVKSYATLNGVLPEGVDMVKTHYIIKKFKEQE
jgi:phospholipase/lecithinase/hemolysin